MLCHFSRHSTAQNILPAILDICLSAKDLPFCHCSKHIAGHIGISAFLPKDLPFAIAQIILPATLGSVYVSPAGMLKPSAGKHRTYGGQFTTHGGMLLPCALMLLPCALMLLPCAIMLLPCALMLLPCALMLP